MNEKAEIAMEIARLLDRAIGYDEDEDAPCSIGCTAPCTDPGRIDVVLPDGTHLTLRVESVG